MVISDHRLHADALDMMGVAISTGACSTGAVETSPTIQVGYFDAVANSVVRLSFGYPTTPHDLTTIFKVFDNF